MSKKPTKKIQLHPRNKHSGNYDFDALVAETPSLEAYVKLNNFKQKTIDFQNPKAVKEFNKALLKKHYDIDYWDIPQNYLCPPIPGRVDYIHHLADLLASRNPKKHPSGGGVVPNGEKIKILDIGVGANCIYPILGAVEHDWSFVATDISMNSLRAAENIINKNENLKGKIELRIQAKPKNIFKAIIGEKEYFEATICNPPFHTSKEEAAKGSLKKQENLGVKQEKLVLNFGGQHNELWCDGGEVRFIKTMIIESKSFEKNCFWFTTLVSKESNLTSVYQMLKKAGVAEHKTIKMAQGNKISRMVAWTFLDKKAQEDWAKKHW